MVSTTPGATVNETPGEILRLLIVVLVFNTTVPLLIITSVPLSGTFPQLQLAGFSHAEETLPVQVLLNFTT